MNVLRVALVLACSLLALPAGAAETSEAEATFASIKIRVLGRILDARFHDIDGDGRDELVTAIWSRTAQRREIRVHRQTPDGLLSVEPDRVVPVLDDVVAWSWADVRDEPGDELVFLTRGGAWSFSLTREGFRGNFTRLVETELLYDVPDPGTLPYWDYTLTLAGQDGLLLPNVDGFSIWGPQQGEGDALELRGEFTTVAGHPASRTRSSRKHGSLQVSGSGISFRAGAGDDVLLDAHAPLLGGDLVASVWRHRSPALVDLDGDGQLDLLRRSGKLLHVHLAKDGVIPTEPFRTERYPAYLDDDDADIEISLPDLDGDGDTDLFVRIKRDEDSALKTNSLFDFLVLINDGERLFPERPPRPLRFEGTVVNASVSDVNGDGLPDIVVTKLQAPSLLELSGPQGLTFTRSTLVFFGQGRGRFSKKPDLRHEDVFDESNLGDAIVTRLLAIDCSGDGRADLVDVDLHGHVAVHRVVRESSFFGGESWSLERSPWRRFAATGSVENLSVRDVNADGLGDILTYRENALTVILSRRGQ